MIGGCGAYGAIYGKEPQLGHLPMMAECSLIR